MVVRLGRNRKGGQRGGITLLIWEIAKINDGLNWLGVATGDFSIYPVRGVRM